MKLYLPGLLSLLLLASCSTAYKTGQTPDDVYFSPERQRDEYARVEKKQPRYNEEQQYASDEDYREDRYLRMKSTYRRYSVLDDCDCFTYTGSNYNRYYDYYRNNNWGYYNRWNTVNWNYNPYNYNPYYYNPYYNKPYYSGYVAGNVRPVYNKPRTGNLSTYSNNGTGNGFQKGSRTFNSTGTNGTSNSENYRNSGSNAGSFLRNTFGSGNSNSSTSTPSTSTQSSSSSSSGSSSSSSGSAAPSRKF